MTSTLEKKSICTFNDTPAEQVESVLQTRPAFIVRIADLGAVVCIGVVRDFENDGADEHAITWGFADSGTFARLNRELSRTLTYYYDEGIGLTAVCRCARFGGGRSLLWLAEERRDPNSKSFSHAASACMTPAQIHGLSRHRELMDERRTKVLALRQRWSLSDATSREQIPGWLPRVAIDLALDKLPAAEETAAPASTRARR